VGPISGVVGETRVGEERLLLKTVHWAKKVPLVNASGKLSSVEGRKQAVGKQDWDVGRLDACRRKRRFGVVVGLGLLKIGGEIVILIDDVFSFGCQAESYKVGVGRVVGEVQDVVHKTVGGRESRQPSCVGNIPEGSNTSTTCGGAEAELWCKSCNGDIGLETEGGSQEKKDAIVEGGGCNVEEMKRGDLGTVVKGAAEVLDDLKEPR
jgi:hypothetical protein